MDNPSDRLIQKGQVSNLRKLKYENLAIETNSLNLLQQPASITIIPENES